MQWERAKPHLLEINVTLYIVYIKEGSTRLFFSVDFKEHFNVKVINWNENVTLEKKPVAKLGTGTIVENFAGGYSGRRIR